MALRNFDDHQMMYVDYSSYLQEKLCFLNCIASKGRLAMNYELKRMWKVVSDHSLL
jgi:hypothetical protein